jgi:translation initiation factor 6 (eIF-6)
MSKLQKRPEDRLVPVAQRSRVRGERGITTAEYAVGTVAAVTGVGILIKIFTSPEFQKILMEIIKAIVELIKGTLGG